ncbi:MAG: endo-1,4-beta-xylanase [Treponema sp.]|nr:endo-1,4-beta-xylanase [Treponema sp.]
MKYITGICLIIFLIFGIFSCTSEPPPGGGVEIPEFDDDIILHEKWPFLVGAAVPGARTNNSNAASDVANALNPGSPQHRLLNHFNVVVAENEMKPDYIMPSAQGGAYNWTDSDALVNYAEANNKKIRGHVLIWHDQTPDWFFRGNGTSGRATIDELYERMEAHIKTVFEKYGGRIEWWDVVNEVIDHDQSGPRRDSRGRYTEIMIDAGKSGMDRYEYVLKAFEWARQYADANGGTDVKLYLTDFGVERPFTRGTSTKQDDFYDLAAWLIEKDAPIDGIGFQGHFRLYDHPVEQISAGIDMFSALERKDGRNLMIQICELDFSIFSNAKGEGQALTISNNLLNERLTDLAATYRDFFDMFKEKYDEGKLDAVLLWGLTDGHSWLNNHPLTGRTDYPLLFNRNYTAKEAYIRLVD